jgi:hypothetical protein
MSNAVIRLQITRSHLLPHLRRRSQQSLRSFTMSVRHSSPSHVSILVTVSSVLLAALALFLTAKPAIVFQDSKKDGGILNWVAPEDKSGEFKRQQSQFRNWIGKDGEFPAEKGRYHLYVSYACPWGEFLFSRSPLF